MSHLIAVHRRKSAVRWMARRCEKFLSRYHNVDYDIETNGERYVLEQLAAMGYGQRGTHIFDVGANVGSWTLAASRQFHDARIHAFEIVPATYLRLAANVGGLTNVVANDFGLSDENGVIDVRHFPDRPTLSSVVIGNRPDQSNVVVTTCQVRRGDRYLEENRISELDLLKIDVEGAEPAVLSGFHDAIRARTARVIQFEYGKVNILTKYLLKDFYEFFRGRGYVVGKIYPNYVDFREYKPEDEDFRGPNYLAVRQEEGPLIARLGQS